MLVSHRFLAWFGFVLVSVSPLCAAEPTLPTVAIELRESLNRVDAGGQNHPEAIAATNSFLARPESATDRLFATFEAMKEAQPRAKNWLRIIAGQLLAKIDDRDSLQPKLQAFFDDRGNDPDARYWVYRVLIDANPSAEPTLLDAARDDPSIPLRYLAIARAMNQAKTLLDQKTDSARDEAIALYQSILPLARHPDHLRDISFSLKELGQEVDLAGQLAMIRSWWLIGPFDNTESAAFDTATPVETEVLQSPSSDIASDRAYTAGDQSVTWAQHTTEEKMGMVDLNAIFDNAKNAAVYGFALIEISEKDLASAIGPTQARFGSICANEVFVNGQRVIANEVYHSGSSIDQYVEPCELKPGVNSVLVKIMQNNQTQPWAQDFQFQFRFTDATGRGIPFTVLSPR